MKDPLDIEMQTARLQGQQHLPELQAFRGLAALVVLMYHCALYYAYSTRLRHVMEHILNAHAAVVSFYVLSGYVLSRSLPQRNFDSRRVSAFYVRRLLRIYPALFAACCLGLAYIVVFHGRPLPAIVSGWWARTYRDHTATPLQVGAAFLGVGSILPLNIWSIFVELIGSTLMPFIVLIRSRGRFSMVLLILALIFLSFYHGEQSRMGYGIYIVDFALGAAIPLIPALFKRLTKSQRTTRFAAFVCLLALMFVRILGGWDFDHNYHSPAAADLEAIAATVLIGLIAQRPEAFSLLRHPSAVWLGDISYSVYLFQLPMIAFIAAIAGEILKLPIFTAGPGLATLSLLAGTLLVTLPSAAMSYRFIELPGLKLGKLLARRVQGATSQSRTR